MCDTEIRRLIVLAKYVFQSRVLRDKKIRRKLKCVLNCCVISVLYRNKPDNFPRDAEETQSYMWINRRTIRIPWTGYVSKVDVSEKMEKQRKIIHDVSKKQFIFLVSVMMKWGLVNSVSHSTDRGKKVQRTLYILNGIEQMDGRFGRNSNKTKPIKSCNGQEDVEGHNHSPYEETQH